MPLRKITAASCSLCDISLSLHLMTPPIVLLRAISLFFTKSHRLIVHPCTVTSARSRASVAISPSNDQCLAGPAFLQCDTAQFLQQQFDPTPLPSPEPHSSEQRCGDVQVKEAVVAAEELSRTFLSRQAEVSEIVGMFFVIVFWLWCS